MALHHIRTLLRLRDTGARAVRNVLGNVYLISLAKNLWYEECEQLDSGGGGALSQGAGHDGSFLRCIAVQKRAVQFTKKPHFPLFSSETADKFAKDYAIKKKASIMPCTLWQRTSTARIKLLTLFVLIFG